MTLFKSIAVTFFLVIIFSNSFGENIVIRYIIEKSILNHSQHNVSDYLLGIVKNNWDEIDLNSERKVPATKTIVLSTPDKEIVLINYTIDRSGIYSIDDLYGHEILLDKTMAGDTLTLVLKLNNNTKISPTGRTSLYLNDSVKSTVFYKIQYPQKFKYMGFFDSLACIHGSLMGQLNYSFKLSNHVLANYIPLVNKVYADRRKFFKDYTAKYDMPSRLKYFVFKEIQYCYYNDLLEPLLQWDAKLFMDYPAAMQDTLKKIGRDLNNRDLFENTWFYRSVIFSYSYLNIGLGDSRTLRDGIDSAYTFRLMNSVKRNLKGESQGYFLASLMKFTAQSNAISTFDLLYQNYDRSSSNSGINGFVDSLYLVTNHPEDISPADIVNLNFENPQHKSVKLGDLFRKDLIVIDCWATWCIPCRLQMPALDSLVNEYQNKIEFISISADQVMNKWDGWLLKENKLNKTILQLYAQNGFNNVFFKKLMINSIPRYILLSKSGKILNAAMPYPSDKESFKKEISKWM